MDGRTWLAVRDRVLQQMRAGGPIPLDIEHAHHYDAAKPIAGVLSDFQVQPNGALDAAVDWNELGTAEYTKGGWGISPVLSFDPSTSYLNVAGTVRSITSAGLTKRPNFSALAVNTSDAPLTLALFDPEKPSKDSTESMDAEKKETPATPGLAEVIAAACATAVNAAIAPVVERLTKLETPAAPAPKAPEVSEIHKTACNAALEKYISAAKLPNTAQARAHFLSQCETAEKLAACCAYYEQAPAIVADAASLETPASTAANAAASAEEIRICRMFGRDPKDLK